MASILNATTTSGVAISPDNSGSLQLQTNNGTTAVTIDTSQRVAFVAGTAALPAITTSGDTNTGMFFPAADTIAFAEGGSETMRLDSSGNVGIGTSSPATKVDINGGGVVRVSTNDTNSTTKESKYVIRHYTNSEEDPMIVYAFSDSTDNQIIYGGGSSAQNSATVHRFFTSANNTTTSGTERMRIASGGNVGVGTNAPNYRLSVTDAVDRTETTAQFGVEGNGYTAFHWLNGTAYYIGQNSDNRELRMYSGSSPTTGVRLTAGATSWASTSDEREKDIIEPITDATNKLVELRTVIGKYKTDDENTRRSFLIAQDVEKVFPEAVSEDSNGTLSLRYTDLIPVLVKAIQEQQAQIEELKAEVQALKGVA